MSDVNIAISNDVIKGIIQNKIAAAVAQALGANEIQVLETIIDRALSVKVDHQGNASSGYRSDIPLLEWLCKEAVTNAAKAAVADWLKLQEPKIKAAIHKQLARNSASIAEQFVASMQEQVKNQYGFRIEAKFEVTPPQR